MTSTNIEKFDNILIEDNLKQIEHDIARKGYTFGWPSNKQDEFGHWNCMFAGQDPDNRQSIEQQLTPPLKQLWTTIKQTVLPGYTAIRAYSNAYTYGTEGYVHTDSDVDTDRTVLIYLNKEWDRDWAGETVFFNDSEIIESILPKYGRVVVFPSNTPHVARSVSRKCTKDRRILTIKAKKNEYAVEGADTTAHSGRTLADHLQGTYDMLKKVNAPEHVCIAGAIHSIYGTNSFETATVDLAQRATVQEKYGTEAEHLAYLFCTIDRPVCLETKQATNWRTNEPVDITDIEYEYLQLIEAANLIEQRSNIGNFPAVYSTWTKYQQQTR
jgi:hypothetical protein